MRRRVIFVISQLFLRLRNSRNIIKCFGQRYVLASNSETLIQWSIFFLQYFGGITSPSFSFSYIKTPEHHFLLFSSQFIIFRASKHPNSSPIRSFIIFSKKKLQRSSRTTKISSRSCLRKFYFHNFLYLLG